MCTKGYFSPVVVDKNEYAQADNQLACPQTQYENYDLWSASRLIINLFPEITIFLLDLSPKPKLITGLMRCSMVKYGMFWVVSDVSHRNSFIVELSSPADPNPTKPNANLNLGFDTAVVSRLVFTKRRVLHLAQIFWTHTEPETSKIAPIIIDREAGVDPQKPSKRETIPK